MAQPIDLKPLRASPVFEGIPPREHEPLIRDLKATTRRFERGSALRRMGDDLEFYPIILTGKVQATIPQGGQDRIVAQFVQGESFAEAVPATLKRCPVDIWALEDTCILCIPVTGLDACTNPWAATVRDNLTNELSKKVLKLSRTLAVLGEPRLSDRILAYLDTLPHNDDGSVTVPFNRQDWAGCLRVVDKSLIRELRVMQDAGIVVVDGRRITVLKRD